MNRSCHSCHSCHRFLNRGFRPPLSLCNDTPEGRKHHAFKALRQFCVSRQPSEGGGVCGPHPHDKNDKNDRNGGPTAEPWPTANATPGNRSAGTTRRAADGRCHFDNVEVACRKTGPRDAPPRSSTRDASRWPTGHDRNGRREDGQGADRVGPRANVACRGTYSRWLAGTA